MALVYNNAPFNKMFREIAVVCSLSEKIYEGTEKAHSTCIAHPTQPG